jgi:hypothetical protein
MFRVCAWFAPAASVEIDLDDDRVGRVFQAGITRSFDAGSWDLRGLRKYVVEPPQLVVDGGNSALRRVVVDEESSRRQIHSPNSSFGRQA